MEAEDENFYSDNENHENEAEYRRACDENETDALRALLEQKDRDLMLAAELGKALLEKNTELEKKLELVTDELNQNIEDLEQERHGLHLKLENLEAEYENAVKELQYDINTLREELDKHKHDAFNGDKSKLSKIHELTQQNERLLEELQNSKRREQTYEDEIQSFKDSSLASMSAKQAYQIEHLQEQLASICEQRAECERRCEKLADERESLISVIEETQDRMKVLERQKADNEVQLRQKDEEIRELHERNSQMTLQLDQLTEKASNSSGNSMTLFNELSQLPGNHELSMATSSPVSPYPPSMFGDDDIECDDDDYLMTSSSPVRFEHSVEPCLGKKDSKIEDEILHAYKHLKQICREIKSQMGARVADASDEEYPCSEDSGSLNEVMIELRDTVHSAIQQASQTQTSHLSEIQSLQQRVGDLERDLSECQGNLQKLSDQLQLRDIHLQQKSYKITELSRQVTAQHEDIKILSNQRDKLQDMLASDTAKPQMYSAMALLRHARRERDAAIDRRYNMEKELQQTKYEIIVLNHQLMEAIHQKNKVSQLLDQWQSDMANLLGVQMEAVMKPSGVNVKQINQLGDNKEDMKKQNEEQIDSVT